MPVSRKTLGLVLFLGMLTCLIVSCTKGHAALLGSVMERNADPRKRTPIPGVEVTAWVGSTIVTGQTDASGYFNLKLRGWVRSGQPVSLEFRHPGFEPVSLNDALVDKLLIVEMTPIFSAVREETEQPRTAIANVKVRYSVKTTGAMNVGSAVKAFEIENTGNLPCDGKFPCSPDGKWKASVGGTTLNAGEGNVFRNVRLSCIAGPCAFTQVQSDEYTRGGNQITASVLDWSDTATFLLEAEVYRTMVSDVIQDSYPVIFGHTLNFSVPETGEGVSIEAEVNGAPIVFPLGPSLCLSWADCTAATEKDHSQSYRCELKDGFAFR